MYSVDNYTRTGLGEMDNDDDWTQEGMSDEDEHVCHATNADNEMIIMMIVILPTTTGR